MKKILSMIIVTIFLSGCSALTKSVTLTFKDGNVAEYKGCVAAFEISSFELYNCKNKHKVEIPTEKIDSIKIVLP